MNPRLLRIKLSFPCVSVKTPIMTEILAHDAVLASKCSQYAFREDIIANARAWRADGTRLTAMVNRAHMMTRMLCGPLLPVVSLSLCLLFLLTSVC